MLKRHDHCENNELSELSVLRYKEQEAHAFVETLMPHAIQIRQTGGPEVLSWTPIEVGEPGSGQVRLRQAAAGLDYIPVKAGDLILVRAAAGRTGLILCQWAPAVGATVIGTVSTEAKAESGPRPRLQTHHPLFQTGFRRGGFSYLRRTSISALRSRTPRTPTGNWKRAQPRAPPS